MTLSVEVGMRDFVAELFCNNDLSSEGAAYSLSLLCDSTWNHSFLRILIAIEDLTKSLIVSLRHHEGPIANFDFGNSYAIVKLQISLPLSSFKSIFIFSTSVSGNYRIMANNTILHRREHESTKSRSPSLIPASRGACTFLRLLGIR